MRRFAPPHLERLPTTAALLLLLLGCSEAGRPTGPLAPLSPPGVSPLQPEATPGSEPSLAGAVPMRRLTREQYQNTVRDVLGVEYPATARLAGDEVVAGYRTNTVLAVQELHVEQFQAAAEEIAELATSPERVAALAPCSVGADTTSCASGFIEAFGRRAYRRPLALAEAQRLLGLYTLGASAADYATGIRFVVEAVLQSPHFLYRPELGRVTDGQVPIPPGSRVELSTYELASRLSYFLWNTTPDEALLSAAASDELSTTEQVTSHAARLLADDRARQMWSSFAQQWLGTDSVAALERDPVNYPLFTSELRSSYAQELGRYFDYVVRQRDGLLSTLLTSRNTLLNGPLYAVYGLATPAAASVAEWAEATLPAGQRAGFLTLAPILAAGSHADQTSLVRRGFMIRTKLLCTTPPPPPPDVVAKAPAVDPSLTARERFALHRSNPICAGCHTLMDPLGLPFELYDPIGAYRTLDGQKPVDPSGALTGTVSQDGDVTGPIQLIEKLAAAEEVSACVAKQFFRYAFSRVETDEDVPALQAFVDDFRAGSGSIPRLLQGMAVSPSFRSGRSP